MIMKPEAGSRKPGGWGGGRVRVARLGAKEGRLDPGVPLYVAASRRSSGERRLANRNQQVVVRLRGKHVVLLVQPGKLCFEIAYSLLQAAHL
jgi:hypothetical protein